MPAGRDLVDAASLVTINRSVPHGHVAAVWAIAQQLGLPALLGPAGRMRDPALALVISRAVAPASKPATLTAWDDVTLGADLAVAGASTDEVYAAWTTCWTARTRSRRVSRPSIRRRR